MSEFYQKWTKNSVRPYINSDYENLLVSFKISCLNTWKTILFFMNWTKSYYDEVNLNEMRNYCVRCSILPHGGEIGRKTIKNKPFKLQVFLVILKIWYYQHVEHGIRGEIDTQPLCNRDLKLSVPTCLIFPTRRWFVLRWNEIFYNYLPSRLKPNLYVKFRRRTFSV